MTLDPSVTSQSRSDAQQAAEHEVRAVLSDELGIELLPRRVDLENGAYVNVDGRPGMAGVRDERLGDRAPCRGAPRGCPCRADRCPGTPADGQPEPPGRDRARVTPCLRPEDWMPELRASLR
jgi:hypothetical protein